MLRKLILLNLAVLIVLQSSSMASDNIQRPNCSKTRLALLNAKNLVYSQNFKNWALKEAICCRDYCATKFWLEHGADFDKACDGLPMRFKNGSTLYLPVILYLIYPITEIASNEQMLELLKDYGIEEIRHQLKSGFNKICIC